MLAVTEAAGTLLARMLEEEEVPEGLYVRFSFEGEDTVNVRACAPETGDTAYCHEGKIVLLVDTKTAAAVSDHILDVEELDDGPSLVLEACTELNLREEAV
jgi:hypothetical protein